ncbi:acyltransferase [Morganella sp. Je.2.23]|uniref:acyltransferase family protein n=1 Tax=Morganella sp. Je.2.23 TaxID=3142840 RepID=UPI003DA7AD9E
MTPANTTLHGLTIFRFVAAFYVFIFHCHLRFPFEGPLWLTRFIGNGAIGMTFFFVLSGFVMAWSAQRGLRSNYYKARFARIYPAYLFMGLLTLPFLYDLNIQKSFASIVIFLLNIQSWIPQTFSTWNFGGSWSVSTELSFYILFPFFLPIILSNPYKSLFLSITISGALIPLVYVYSKDYIFPTYYVGPIYRLPEFISGVALGVLVTNKNLQIKNKVRYFSFFISIFSLVLICPIRNSIYMYNNLLTVGSTLSVVYFLSTINIDNKKYLHPFIYLGKISYSFYLMQLPVLMVIDKYHHFLSHYNKGFVFLSAGVINLALAIFSYHYIEEKFKLSYKNR